MLERCLGKSHNLGTNLEKTWILMIFAKYLHIYKINHSKNHPRKNYENKSHKDANFAYFRQNNCIFTLQIFHLKKRKKNCKNVLFFNNQ